MVEKLDPGEGLGLIVRTVSRPEPDRAAKGRPVPEALWKRFARRAHGRGPRHLPGMELTSRRARLPDHDVPRSGWTTRHRDQIVELINLTSAQEQDHQGHNDRSAAWGALRPEEADRRHLQPQRDAPFRRPDRHRPGRGLTPSTSTPAHRASATSRKRPCAPTWRRRGDLPAACACATWAARWSSTSSR